MKLIQRNSILAVSALVALSGCATTTTVSENPTSMKLEPMEKPEIVAGTRIQQLDKISGEERYYEIIKINEDGTHIGVNQDGCQWSNFGDHVSPATSWGNCGGTGEWTSGENRDMKVSGNIWPLTVGNKASYSYTQVNAYGDVKKKTSRKCKVDSQVNIETALGSMDTFKIICARRSGDWSQTRVYYFSPDYGHSVKYVQSSSSDGIERDTELLRVDTL